MDLILLVALAVGLLAFSNGANANFKGVASLYGSGTTGLTTALVWGTCTTFLGSVVAMYFANGMIVKFSGKGLVDEQLLVIPEFLASVALGAALTSILANRTGFPVSTTHALVGALIGAGLSGGDRTISLAALWNSFIFPMLFSPILAMILGCLAWKLYSGLRFPVDKSTRYSQVGHFLSGGATSFARGLNDTPKMAALLLVAPYFDVKTSVIFVGVVIAIGAMIDARKVAETLGKKVTGMTPTQGLASNVMTALLVTTASWHSLPVSTTHVSVGSMLGVGAITNQARWKNVAAIVLAWVITVPCGAAFAAILFAGLHWYASSR